jgi:O-antigen/teichoic acid export membrane protein
VKPAGPACRAGQCPTTRVCRCLFLNSTGLPPSVVIAWLTTCVLNIVIALWAIPRYGIKGASVASAICYSVMLLSVLRIVRAQRKRATVSLSM